MMKERRGVSRERMTILGEIDADAFIPWIRRHAAKLGLSSSVLHASSDRIELDIAGLEELLDMMEMGCSLGPIDVWVESIQRTPIDGEAG